MSFHCTDVSHTSSFCRGFLSLPFSEVLFIDSEALPSIPSALCTFDSFTCSKAFQRGRWSSFGLDWHPSPEKPCKHWFHQFGLSARDLPNTYQFKTEHLHMMSLVIFFKCFSSPIWSTFHTKEAVPCWSWLNYVNCLILVAKGNLLVLSPEIGASMCSFEIFTVALLYEYKINKWFPMYDSCNFIWSLFASI